MDRPVLPPPMSAGIPLLASERCINTVFAGVNCSRCSDACPVDAIEVKERSARIDERACLGCGACFPECPTEAITARSPSLSLRLGLADLPPNDAVLLACPRREAHDSSVSEVRHDRCLAEIGTEQLFVLVGGREGDVWLDDRECARCELAVLRASIEHAVDGVNALLHGCGHRATVHLASAQEPRSDSRRPAAVVRAGQGGMSRRGLFRRLIGEVTERVSLQTGDDHLSQRRQRFLAALDKVGTSPSTSAVVLAGFGDVVVDGVRCSACGLCAEFCPTGALVFTITTEPGGREKFDLRAQAARCVDCGVCAAACPEAAITVVARADLQALVDRASRSVASGAVLPCEVCGAGVADTAGRPARCFSCRDGVVSPLRDEVGLMADLLSRLPSQA